MGFGIGVTFMTGNRAGVRSKTDAKGRALGHQGDAGALLRELGEERYSATNNLDRSRSHLNPYGVGGLGRFRSGQEAYDYLCEEVAAYDRRAKEAAVAAGRRPPRAVRSDAPVMVSVIVEPDGEYMATLTEERQRRLLADCALALVECGYIDSPDDVLISTIHMDEKVPHGTVAFINRDPSTGRIGTSRYNSCEKTDLLHRDFLDALRAKGWEGIEDHDVVDRKRLKTDPEYAASRKRKRRKQGRSANAYAAEKEAEKARERADAAVREADEAAREAEAALKRARKATKRAKGIEKELNEKKKELDAGIAKRRQALTNLDADIAERRQALTDLDDDVRERRGRLDAVTARLGDAEGRERELDRREEDLDRREADIKCELDERADDDALIEDLMNQNVALSTKVGELERANRELRRRLRSYELSDAPEDPRESNAYRANRDIDL